MAGNASDLYRRERIPLLVKAIEQFAEKEGEASDNVVNQKSSLKLSILNMIDLTAKFLTGHYLITNNNSRSDYVVMFLCFCLKIFENDNWGWILRCKQ